jgi:hypothetical protein
MSGTEDDVFAHTIHVDQLRVDIDLADSEYRKLLQPYIEAGSRHPLPTPQRRRPPPIAPAGGRRQAPT